MTFYTYIHRRADDGRVFYVGKGQGRRAFSTYGRNQHWQRTVQKHGISVEIAARWASEEDAYSHERFLVACFRDLGHPLCNRTSGGDGTPGYRHSSELRARWSEIRTGRAVSDDTRAKMSASHKARTPHPNSIACLYGRPVSEETRARMSAAQRGHSAVMKGRPWSEARRAAQKKGG